MVPQENLRHSHMFAFQKSTKAQSNHISVSPSYIGVNAGSRAGRPGVGHGRTHESGPTALMRSSSRTRFMRATSTSAPNLMRIGWIVALQASAHTRQHQSTPMRDKRNTRDAPCDFARLAIELVAHAE
jgi:hypothetical protein